MERITSRLLPRGLPVVVAIFAVPRIFMGISHILVPDPCPARSEYTRARIRMIHVDVEVFNLNHGRYPEKNEDLVARPSCVAPGKRVPFIPRSPRDAWDREFVYRVPGTDGFPFDLVSYGADGRPGGPGFDEDLWNHARAK